MDQWIAPRKPTSGAADVVGIPAQLYINPHVPFVWTIPVAGVFGTFMESIFGVLVKTPIGAITPLLGDILQPDNTVTDYYKIKAWFPFYLGFPQTFLGVWCTRCESNGNDMFIVG